MNLPRIFREDFIMNLSRIFREDFTMNLSQTFREDFIFGYPGDSWKSLLYGCPESFREVFTIWLCWKFPGRVYYMAIAEFPGFKRTCMLFH